MRKILVTWALAVLGQALAASPAAAQGNFQNLDQIDALVAQTTGADIGQPGGARAPVDRRLRLAACPITPAIEGPVFGSAIVRCDRLGWRIRVPLALAPTPAPVAAAPAPAPVPQQRVVLIRKGDPVQLVAGNDSFTVSRQMIADADGAVGEMIPVRESRSAPAVSGRVEANGVVRVPGI